METENAGVEEEVLGAEDETGVEDDDARAPEGQEDDTDWKAVAAKERERADNYKRALHEKRGLRKQQIAQVEEPADEPEERPITASQLQEAIEATVGPLMVGNKVDSFLIELVKDPAKREAVKLIYENRIRQTGTSDAAIREDLEAAIGIADQNKNRKALNEIERIQNRRTTVPLNGAGNEHGQERKTHGFSTDQVKELTKRAQASRLDPEKFIAEAWKNTKKR